MILHGVLIAAIDRGRWRGALIVGPSGAGKSDLALRLMDCGLQLVADDQVVVWASGEQVYGKAPETLHGLIEARGLGILGAPIRTFSPIDLLVDVDPAAAIERMPEPAHREVAGVQVPLLRLRALEASAPAKIRRWLMMLG